MQPHGNNWSSAKLYKRTILSKLYAYSNLFANVQRKRKRMVICPLKEMLFKNIKGNSWNQGNCKSRLVYNHKMLISLQYWGFLTITIILYMAHNIIMYITVIIISYYTVHSVIITSRRKRLASNGSGNRGTELAKPAQEHGAHRWQSWE